MILPEHAGAIPIACDLLDTAANDPDYSDPLNMHWLCVEIIHERCFEDGEVDTVVVVEHVVPESGKPHSTDLWTNDEGIPVSLCRCDAVIEYDDEGMPAIIYHTHPDGQDWSVLLAERS